MNTPLPSPQDELEMRVTALLLGQLSAEETTALRLEMQQNQELQKLHDRLQQTIGLVREARGSFDEITTAPAERLTLSADRRAQLLASFKTIRPKELAQQQQRRFQRRELMLVAAMLAGLMGVASILVTLNQPKARASLERPQLLAIRPEYMVEEESAAPATPKPAQPESDEKPASGITRNWFFSGEVAGKSVAMPADKLSLSVDRPTDPAAATPKVQLWDTATGKAVDGRDGIALGVPASGTRLSGRGEVNGVDFSAAKDGDTVDVRKLAAGGSRGAMPATERFGTVGIGVNEPQAPLDVAGRADKSAALPKELAQIVVTPTTPAAPSPVELPMLGRRFNESGRKTLDDVDYAGVALEKKTPAEPSVVRGYRSQVVATPAPAALPPPPAPPADAAFQAAPARSIRARVLSTADGSEGLVRQLAEQPVVTGAVSAGQDQKISYGLAPASKPAENQALARYENSLAEQNSPTTTTLEHFATAPQLVAKSESAAVADLGNVANGSLNFGANQTVAEKDYFAYAVTPSTGLPVDTLARVTPTADAPLAPIQLQIRSNSVRLGYQGVAQAGTTSAEVRFHDQSQFGDFVIGDPQHIGLLDIKAAETAGAGDALSLGGGTANALTPPGNQLQRVDQQSLVKDAIANGANLNGRRAELQFQEKLAAEDFADFERRTDASIPTDGTVSKSSTARASLWAKVRNALTPSETTPTKKNVAGGRAEDGRTMGVAKTDSTTELDFTEFEAKKAKPEDALAGVVNREQLALQRNQQFEQTAARGEVLRREKLLQVDTAWQDQKQSDPAPIRRPAPNAATPQPEVITADNAFSTFSLNVSDVSFKLAAASLEKNQMPDAASVRTEEFINAFDYRDPEPTGNRPLAFHWERARYPFAHNRDLVRLSVKTAASGRQPGRPLNLVLLLDNSGSMERSDRIRIRQECLRVLATQLQPSDRVSVVAFARTPRLWVDGLPGSQAGELAGRVGQLTPDGGTNLEEAMNLAYQTARRYFQASGINRVVLLTDGAANLGEVEPDTLRRQVESNRQQGVALDCFGIGWDGYNDDLLEALSRNGDGRYGFINTPEAATTEFAGQLAGALRVAASDVKVQVQFNPRRVTAHRQMGYAMHQLTKEQFRDNTVDAAEIGAAEAGNALYVVEVNPAGEGPLGVARVRFKVPGTSDYREQEWTLAYDGAAKGLAQAAPSLRLAGVAAAFSEWLVASPFAAEVTPSGLQGYLTGVPAAFGTDARPKQLETMLRQAGSLAGK